MVLISNRLNCRIHKTIADPSGRFIALKVEINDKVYIYIDIYAPNKDNVMCKLFKKLHKMLQAENLDCEENIICGLDFNCSLNQKLDKKDGVMQCYR